MEDSSSANECGREGASSVDFNDPYMPDGSDYSFDELSDSGDFEGLLHLSPVRLPPDAELEISSPPSPGAYWTSDIDFPKEAEAHPFNVSSKFSIAEDEEEDLDVFGRKHVNTNRGLDAMYHSNPWGGSLFVRFPTEQVATGALRTYIVRNILPNHIVDEYKNKKAAEDLIPEQLVKLQARQWWVHTYSKPVMPSQEELEKGPVDAVVSMLLRSISKALMCSSHVFVYRDRKAGQTHCDNPKCDVVHKDLSITKQPPCIVIEPLIDIKTLTPATDLYICQGELLVFRRDDLRFREFGIHIPNMVNADNPFCFCLPCLQFLWDSRAEVWKYLATVFSQRRAAEGSAPQSSSPWRAVNERHKIGVYPPNYFSPAGSSSQPRQYSLASPAEASPPTPTNMTKAVVDADKDGEHNQDNAKKEEKDSWHSESGGSKSGGSVSCGEFGLDGTRDLSPKVRSSEKAHSGDLDTPSKRLLFEPYTPKTRSYQRLDSLPAAVREPLEWAPVNPAVLSWLEGTEDVTSLSSSPLESPQNSSSDPANIKAVQENNVSVPAPAQHNHQLPHNIGDSVERSTPVCRPGRLSTALPPNFKRVTAIEVSRTDSSLHADVLRKAYRLAPPPRGSFGPPSRKVQEFTDAYSMVEFVNQSPPPACPSLTSSSSSKDYSIGPPPPRSTTRPSLSPVLSKTRDMGQPLSSLEKTILPSAFDPPRIFCTCYSNAQNVPPSARIVHCTAPTCPSPEFHYVCLDKKQKSAATRGVFVCDYCKLETEQKKQTAMTDLTSPFSKEELLAHIEGLNLPGGGKEPGKEPNKSVLYDPYNLATTRPVHNPAVVEEKDEGHEPYDYDYYEDEEYWDEEGGWEGEYEGDGPHWLD